MIDELTVMRPQHGGGAPISLQQLGYNMIGIDEVGPFEPLQHAFGVLTSGCCRDGRVVVWESTGHSITRMELLL